MHLAGHEAKRHIIENGYLELPVDLFSVLLGNCFFEIKAAESLQVLISCLCYLLLLKELIPLLLLLLDPFTPFFKSSVF